MPAATTNKAEGFHLFDTALGRCALLWRGGLVVGAALPEADDGAMRRSLARRFPGADEADPPGFVRSAAAAVARALAGERDELAAIGVGFDGASEFDRRVWEATRAIPRGEVRSYGEVASAVGAPRAAQAVGLALGRNPVPILVPCHRVLASSGSGGFSAPGGAATKFRLLEIELAARAGDGTLFGRLPFALRPAARE